MGQGGGEGIFRHRAGVGPGRQPDEQKIKLRIVNKVVGLVVQRAVQDRKSTRLNSSHP